MSVVISPHLFGPERADHSISAIKSVSTPLVYRECIFTFHNHAVDTRTLERGAVTLVATIPEDLLLTVLHHQGSLDSNGHLDPSRVQPSLVPVKLHRSPDLIRGPEGAEAILSVTELDADRVLGVEFYVGRSTKDTWFHKLLKVFPSFVDRVVEMSCAGDEMEQDVGCDQEEDCVPAGVSAKVEAEATKSDTELEAKASVGSPVH